MNAGNWISLLCLAVILLVLGGGLVALMWSRDEIGRAVRRWGR